MISSRVSLSSRPFGMIEVVDLVRDSMFDFSIVNVVVV